MTSGLTPRARARLLAAARAAARRSHSPYSRFRVGAAVMTAGGIFTGTNVENASYPLSLCAERSALAAAVAGGGGVITAIAVSCIDATRQERGERMPCGACRQWFVELAPDAAIIVDGIDGAFSVEDLLPAPFTLTPRGVPRRTGRVGTKPRPSQRRP